MSRKPRRHSESGIYHVMLRGIDRQIIFQDDEDRGRFLQVLRDCKDTSHFQLYAYCLMDNHIHLLLQTMPEEETLEVIFKRIGVRYVAWYNRKYGRTGPLFQDRYLSEPVDSDAYLWTVLPYIHQNPVKAGLCIHVEEYPWCSWREYLSPSGICDTKALLALLDEDPQRAMKQFYELHNKPNEMPCLDLEQYSRPTDKDIQAYLVELCGVSNTTELQALPSAKRAEMIYALKQRRASIRQISRLTGWSIGIVRNR